MNVKDLNLQQLIMNDKKIKGISHAVALEINGMVNYWWMNCTHFSQYLSGACSSKHSLCQGVPQSHILLAYYYYYYYYYYGAEDSTICKLLIKLHRAQTVT